MSDFRDRGEPSAFGIVLQAAAGAAGDVLSPPLRKLLWYSLGLTLLLLFALGTGMSAIINWLADQSVWLSSYPYISAIAVVLAAAGVFVGLIFLIPPVSAVVAGYFLDDVAAVVEARCDPGGRPGTALPVGQALIAGLRFAALSLGVNLLALLLLLVPGVNLIAFLAANAYLFGREYFELAAGRYRSVEDARDLRRRNATLAFMGGLVTALLVMVPIVNLVTPLFGTALMVRMHKAVDRQERRRGVVISAPR
ncbi:sulfate transporter family protein [Pseudochelatococcus contaminans]|uniref:CysZ protein n=1 Tax=Pseudochelatococcus contaminans TaxID=1538103 RepID=A0A7W5Z508_9HYPH|nr:sulfate transporter family protein [Pseudochelatococcus contaminans]MBB3809656.1 CysZ protein [Pseudochelatococcus contaminans]